MSGDEGLDVNELAQLLDRSPDQIRASIERLKERGLIREIAPPALAASPLLDRGGGSDSTDIAAAGPSAGAAGDTLRKSEGGAA